MPSPGRVSGRVPTDSRPAPSQRRRADRSIVVQRRSISPYSAGLTRSRCSADKPCRPMRREPNSDRTAFRSARSISWRESLSKASRMTVSAEAGRSTPRASGTVSGSGSAATVTSGVSRHLVDRLKRDAPAGDLGEDVLAGGGPYEWFGVVVVRGEVVLDLGDEVGYGVEHAAAQRLVGQFPKPALDQVEPRRGGRGEVQVESGVLVEPGRRSRACGWRSCRRSGAPQVHRGPRGRSCAGTSETRYGGAGAGTAR